jgi:hypothetical protein
MNRKHTTQYGKGAGFSRISAEMLNVRGMGEIIVEVAATADVANGTSETVWLLVVRSSGCANFPMASTTSTIGKSRRST